MKRFFLLFAVLVIFPAGIATAEELPRFSIYTSHYPVLGPNYYDAVTHLYNPDYVTPKGHDLYINAFPGEEVIETIHDPEPPQGGGRPEDIKIYRLKVPSDTKAIDFSIEQVDGQFSDSTSMIVGDLQRSSSQRPPSLDDWSWNARVPREGIYQITVKLRNNDGGGPQGTRRITVQDFLIVSIGDSSASGQGNPDVPGRPKGFEVDFSWWDLIPPLGIYKITAAAAEWGWNYLKQKFTTLTRAAEAKIDMDPDPIWLEWRAYRSLQSGPALAARRLESDGRTVTFLSFARSGAEIIQGLIGPRTREGDIPKALLERCFDKLILFYVTNEFNGTSSLEANCTSVIRELSKNIDVAPQSLCLGLPSIGLSPELSLLKLCSTVAEDVLKMLEEADIVPIPKVPIDTWIHNLGQIEEAKDTLGDRRIDALLINIGVNDVGMSGTLEDMIKNDFGFFKVRSDTNERRKIRRRVEKRLSELPALFEKLEEALKTLNVRHVYLIEYPTSLFDRKDGKPARGCEIFTSFLDFDLTKGDAIIVKETAVALNAALKREAEKRGWFFVSGVAERFSGRGYCTSNNIRYFVQAEESLVLQGDTEGTIHPNGPGHQVYAEQIAAAVDKNTIKVRECASPTEALCLWFLSD